MNIEPGILYPALAVITAYMGFIEVRWQRSSTDRSSMHTRISLLESKICTTDDVRAIIRDENISLIKCITALTDKVEKLVNSTHEMQLTMAKRRANDDGDED